VAHYLTQQEPSIDQRTTRSPPLKPLPPEESPGLKEQFEAMRKNLGFMRNSILIMARTTRSPVYWNAPASSFRVATMGYKYQNLLYDVKGRKQCSAESILEPLLPFALRAEVAGQAVPQNDPP
jgi:hypothetical protein